MTNVVIQVGSYLLVRSVVVMTAHQNFAFQNLLSAWRRREDARAATSLAELAEARATLDSARNDMRSALQSIR